MQAPGDFRRPSTREVGPQCGSSAHLVVLLPSDAATSMFFLRAAFGYDVLLLRYALSRPEWAIAALEEKFYLLPWADSCSLLSHWSYVFSNPKTMR